MMSVPQEHQPHHDQPSLGGLRRKYPEWAIDPPGALHVWTAELREPGGAVRFLAGHTIGELADRLRTATAIEYGRGGRDA